MLPHEYYPPAQLFRGLNYFRVPQYRRELQLIGVRIAKGTAMPETAVHLKRNLLLREQEVILVKESKFSCRRNLLVGNKLPTHCENLFFHPQFSFAISSGQYLKHPLVSLFLLHLGPTKHLKKLHSLPGSQLFRILPTKHGSTTTRIGLGRLGSPLPTLGNLPAPGYFSAKHRLSDLLLCCRTSDSTSSGKAQFFSSLRTHSEKPPCFPVLPHLCSGRFGVFSSTPVVAPSTHRGMLT